jgi:hypothetical protein
MTSTGIYTQLMLEMNKTKYQSSKTLSKSKIYHIYNKEVQNLCWDLFPLCNDYYHELNPAFLFKISDVNILNQFPAVTVRDGSATLAAFILNNFRTLDQLTTHFFISSKLANLVPQHLRHKFSIWDMVQTNKSHISQAKRVLIYGIMSDSTLDPLIKLKEQLSILKHVSEACEIDICLPRRICPLTRSNQESHLAYEIIEVIKDYLPHKKLNFMLSKDLFERATWAGTYCIDLMASSLAIEDSFLNYRIASQGGTVSTLSEIEDINMKFEIDLSFNHKIQFSPLPEVESLFPEMIFYKKSTRIKDHASDPVFHQLLRKK